jgi:hypothetical protein
MLLRIILLHFSEARNVRSYRDGTGCRERVGAAGHDLAARPALPNAHAGALDRVLAAKDATIGRVLRNFHLLDELAERGTVAGSVLSDNADLFRAFGHLISICCVVVVLFWKETVRGVNKEEEEKGDSVRHLIPSIIIQGRTGAGQDRISMMWGVAG